MTVTEYLEAEVTLLKAFKGLKDINGYVSISDFILRNGTQFLSASLNEEEEEYVRSLGFKGSRIKECYKNTQHALLFHLPCLGMTLEYVEGYACASILPVMHSWLSLNGKVIDPTWGPRSKSNRRLGRILGTFPPDYDYYGVVIEEKKVSAFINNHHVWSSIIDDYHCHYPLLTGKECKQNGDD